MSLKIIGGFICLILVLGQNFSYPVFAEEYSISGNGEGSSSQINVKQEESKAVEQNNNTEIKNEVKAESETGNNQASGNSGETEIKTGDASQDTTVINSGNTNEAQAGCCPTYSGGSATISGNGADSQNQINSSQTMGSNITQNNGAKITNNITVYANTGDNEASDNLGNSTITTGDINIQTAVFNQGNNSYAKIGGSKAPLDIKIAGNGASSVNDVDENNTEYQVVYVNNYLDLSNNVKHFASTGGNKAYKNLGNVKIITGDIYLDIILSNKFNNSVVIADCGCKETPQPTPKPSETPIPSTPPSGGENGGGGGSGGSSSGGSGGTSDSGSSSSSGGSGGSVLGVSLPATGGFSLIQATLLALSLLGSGIILKLDWKPKRRKNQISNVKKHKATFKVNIFHRFAKICGKFVNWKLPAPIPRYLFAGN